MTSKLEKPAAIILLLAALCSHLFFFDLGTLGVTDPDETFYAQTAKEMVQRGEWVTPYLYGKPQFEKPILLYWLLIPSFKVFGVNEFAARFPSAIFGLLGVILMYLLGALFFSKRVGILAGIIFATSIEYLILSRACVTDMVLSTCMLGATLFFFYGYFSGKKWWYLFAAAAIAMAALTKGPIFPPLWGAAILITLVAMKDLFAIRRMPLLMMALVFLAVAFPWYLAVYKVHGKTFIDAFFGFQNVTRFLESEHKIGSQFYYNIPILFGGFFPWSLFVPFGIYRALKHTASADAKKRAGAIFSLAYFLVIFGFFTASSTKLPTYIFPSFAALALIVASLWDEFFSADASRQVIAGMRWSYGVLVAGVICGVIALYLFLKIRYPVMLATAWISGAALLLGFVLSLVSFARKKKVLAFFFIIYALFIFSYPLAKLVIPDLEHYETSKELSRKLSTYLDPEDKIGSEKDYVAGVTFYTDKEVSDITKHEALVQFLNRDKRVWVVLKEKNHKQLYDPSINSSYVPATYMVYKVGKKCIVTNRIPRDGRYLAKRELKQ